MLAPKHAAHLDNFLAMVDDRKVEPYGGVRADFGRWILGGQDAPLHRGELGMFDEKALDLVQVVRRSDEVVVKAYDYIARGLTDGHVLDSAFAGTRVVQMLERRSRRRERRRDGSAVLGHEDFVRSFARGDAELRCQAIEQARERVRTCMSRDYRPRVAK